MAVESGSPIPYRELRPVAESLFTRFVGALSEKLDDPSLDRGDVCRDAIAELYGSRYDAARLEDESLPLRVRAQWASFDPRNITLEPEYYGDIDAERYGRVKPLIWLWIMFDRSPLGQNAWLGIRLRRALAERIFPRCGIELGNKVSVSDYVNIYSHTHDINDIRTVYLKKTVIADHARITYHATVLAGAHVGKDGMVGAMALATREAPAMQVSVGTPARPIRAKARPCPYCDEERTGRR